MTKLVTNIGPDALATTPRLRVRLYGGWYDRNARTRQAQAIIADATASFPKAIIVSSATATVTVIASVEIVSSLEIEPTFEFSNTYRRYGDVGLLECAPAPFSNCASPIACPLVPTRAAVLSGACPTDSCHVQLSDILSRPQQKLVDTLITADLIQFAATSRTWTAIASCDDDLWPAIRTAVRLGAVIIHLQTKAGRRPSNTYMPRAVGYSYRLY